MAKTMMRIALLGVTVAHAFNNQASSSSPGVGLLHPSKRVTRRAGMPSCADESRVDADPIRPTVLAIALAGVLTSSIYSVQPAGAVERDALKGREVFAANCSGCHAGGTNSIAASKTLRKEALQKYVSASLNADEVETWWRASFHKGSIAEKLSDEGIRDVLGFVVDQAANNRWP